MKKNILFIAIIIILLTLNACFVLSLYPFYLKQNIVTMENIHGKWKILKDSGVTVKENRINPWEFTDTFIKIFDDDNIPAKINVDYFKIEKNYFLDCIAGEPENVTLNENWQSLLYPVHTLLKLVMNNDTLRLIPLNYDKTIESLKSNNKADLSYLEPGGEDQIGIFINGADKWIDFLIKNGNNTEFFNSDNEFLFLRLIEK
jgi:hypothetical protein